MYAIAIRLGKSNQPFYAYLSRSGRRATFENIFSLRKYLRRYDHSLLRITKVNPLGMVF